jgi:hypothetical protein
MAYNCLRKCVDSYRFWPAGLFLYKYAQFHYSKWSDIDPIKVLLKMYNCESNQALMASKAIFQGKIKTPMRNLGHRRME